MIVVETQGTTETSAVNQQLRGPPPFLLGHLVAMLEGQVTWLGEPEEFDHETFQTAVRPSSAPFYAKLRFSASVPMRLTEPFRGPSVYRLNEAGRLSRVRSGAHPACADADRGELLIANTPEPDVVCRPGAEIATFESLTSGPGRPFFAPHAASAQIIRFSRTLQSLFVPVSTPTGAPS